MINSTASIATAAAWSYHCPIIRQFRPDTSYTLWGDKKEWPVYFSLWHSDSMIRLKPSNLGSILVALVPIQPHYHFKGLGKTNAVKEQRIHNLEVCRKVFEHIFCPLNTLYNTGKFLLCVDGHMWQCDPVICGWKADYFENIQSLSVKQPHRPAFEALKSLFESGIHCRANRKTIGYTSKRQYL